MCSPLFDELFVANLASDATESDIKELFEPYAVVKECWVGHKKQLKGSAITSFSSVRVETHSQAIAARKALNNTTYKDRNLVVKWAANHRLLWVGSLPDSVTNEALQAGFSQFGTVERAVVVADAQNPVSRRYGFVLFEEKRDAQKAHGKCQAGVLLFAKSFEPVRVDWARVEDPYEGFSDALATNKRKGSDVNPAVVAHLVSPGTQEHTMAMRVKQLQVQYQQTKQQLKAQIAAVLNNAALAQNTPSSAMAGNMTMGGAQYMPQGPAMSPMGGAGGMAPMPMAPPPMQTPVPTPINPMGMMPTPVAPPPNPMGMAGTLPTIGLGTAPAQPAPMMNQNSMMNQNAMMGNSMAENFHNVPPPSKTQMRSSTDLSGSLPGAKPPGSHDHRGIGFSGAASSSQPTQSQTGYSNNQAANVQGPRPPSTPYPNAATANYGSQPSASVQPTVPSYPPPTSMGANFSTGSFNMGMSGFSAPQMQQATMNPAGTMMQMGMNGANNFGAQGLQSGYATAGAAGTGMGSVGMMGMGQLGMGQLGGSVQQQAAGMQQPMSGYSAPAAFNSGTYAPPPQQPQMY